MPSETERHISSALLRYLRNCLSWSGVVGGAAMMWGIHFALGRLFSVSITLWQNAELTGGSPSDFQME